MPSPAHRDQGRQGRAHLDLKLLRRLRLRPIRRRWLVPHSAEPPRSMGGVRSVVVLRAPPARAGKCHGGGGCRTGAASLRPTNPRPCPRRDPSTCPPAHAKPSAERTAAPCGSAASSPQSHPSDFGETIPISIEIGQGCDLPTSAMIAERTYLSPFTKDNRARMVIRRLNIFCAISIAEATPQC